MLDRDLGCTGSTISDRADSKVIEVGVSTSKDLDISNSIEVNWR